MTIERIRASINTGLCINTLHELAATGEKGDGVRATAALGLLQFALPKLSATDMTSNGEGITVERVMFTRTAKTCKRTPCERSTDGYCARCHDERTP